MRLRKRKATYVLLGVPPHVFAYAVAPLLISRSGARIGWNRARPGVINLTGLVPLASGARMVGWAIVSHFQTAPAESEVNLVPTYLVHAGAYQRTRNPMYLGGATMLVGWTVLLGSVRVGLIAVGFVLGMDRLGIPFEERMLREKFGDSYVSYQQGVPRWF